MKIFKLSIAFILVLIISSTAISAQADQKYWHKSDRYSVELDGEGDAFVVANMRLESISDSNVSEITLEIPNRNVKIYKVIQVPQYYKNHYYNNYEYDPEFLEFEKEKLSDSVKLKLNLAYKLTPDSRADITLIYKSNEIANEEFRGLNFEFETIKDPNSLIRQVGANVQVPDRMNIKGQGEFEIDYKPSVVAEKAMGASSAKSVASLYHPYYGGSQYSARNLDPGESFTVSGLYGDSFFRLYLFEILGFILFVLLVGFFAKTFNLKEKILQLYR